MVIIVVKDKTDEETVKKIAAERNLGDGDYQVMNYDEYKAKFPSNQIEGPISLKETAEKFLEPKYGMNDLTGYLKEVERKEKKFKREQEKWRRKFSR